MRALILAAIAVISATPATAAETIRCTSAGQPDVVLSLDAKRMLGRTVSCIAGDFITDMTPCAPRGAVGLSAPTGMVPLIKIVTPAKGYADHAGGVTGYFVDGSSIRFTGGFHWWDDKDALEGAWQFTLDRSTGKAVLKRDKGADMSQSVADIFDPGSPRRVPMPLEGPREDTYVCRAEGKKP
jgi:hypothetical protein